MLDEINTLTAIGPLIVVPGNEFHESIVQCHTSTRIKHRRGTISEQVIGDDLVIGVAKNSF